MSDNEDFEEQIRLEREAAASAAKQKTKTDEDGTEFEWDDEKQAWFPKIDADFIAKYQLSYGVAADDSGTSAPATTGVQQDYLTYDDYVKFYYATYREAFDIESHLKSGRKDAVVKTQSEQDAKAKALLKEDGTAHFDEDANRKYQEYCDEYYKSWETGNYAYFRKHYNYQDDDDEDGADDAKRKEKKKADKKRKKEEGWFAAEEGANNNVYVSNLPRDINFEEFNEIMNKAGMIMFDPLSKKPKLKLYTDDDGKNKGDGRCCYIKAESVDLALKFLDGSDVRGTKIRVEKAQFALKGEYDPKKRKAISNKIKKKMKIQQEKLFDWRPDKPRFSRAKNERTVVLKHMFDPKEFEVDPTLINEIKEDLKAECIKFGEVKKVMVYDRHAEGVATVTFAEAAFADQCIQFMNKRWFAKRQITAETWDGKARYVVEETDAERDARLKKWEEYLEKGGNPDDTPEFKYAPQPTPERKSDALVASTSATQADIATSADEADIATTAEEADIATTAEEADIATTAEEADIATSAEEADIATSAEEADIATSATVVDISTSIVSSVCEADDSDCVEPHNNETNESLEDNTCSLSATSESDVPPTASRLSDAVDETIEMDN